MVNKKRFNKFFEFVLILFIISPNLLYESEILIAVCRNTVKKKVGGAENKMNIKNDWEEGS